MDATGKGRRTVAGRQLVLPGRWMRFACRGAQDGANLIEMVAKATPTRRPMVTRRRRRQGAVAAKAVASAFLALILTTYGCKDEPRRIRGYNPGQVGATANVASGQSSGSGMMGGASATGAGGSGGLGGSASTGSSTQSASSSAGTAAGGFGGMGGALAAGGMGGALAVGGMGGALAVGGMGGASAAGGMGGSGGMGPPAVVPDFSLLDVNPNSPTSGQMVSPRDYLMKVSGWYFGHAT